MAGLSFFEDPPLLNVLSILRKLQSLGFCSNLNPSVGESTQKPSSLFNRILSVFLKEIHANQHIRPFPATLGDGKLVDLFALYREVLHRGGCRSVTANQSWDSIGKRIGCGSGAGLSVKLVYFKYLDELGNYLGRDCDGNDLKPLSGLEKDRFLTPVRVNGCSIYVASNRNSDDDVVILDPDEGSKEFALLKKRKREPLVGMLDWLLLVAKSPCDPSVGKLISDGPKDGNFAAGFLFSQLLVARQAMFVGRIPLSDDNRSNLQVRQKIDTDGMDKERLKYSTRLDTLTSHSIPGSCLENTAAEDAFEKDSMTKEKHRNQHQKIAKSASSLSDVLASLTSSVKRVGRSYLAEVPNWTSKALVISNDLDESNWLETRIRPSEK